MDERLRDGVSQLAFPVDEYHQRVDAVREQLGERQLHALLVFTPENVTYLTGYETIGYSSYQCLIVPVAGDPVLVVRELELDVAHATTWLQDFVAVADGDAAVDRTIEALTGVVRGGEAVGLEDTSPFVNAAVWNRLKTAIGPNAQPCSGVVERGRRTKTVAEAAKARDACRLVEAGMSAAIGAVHAGVTENQVAVEAYAAMVGGGSGFLAADPIVTSGPRSGIAHTTFGGRRLTPGDTVLIELGACRDRYFGALLRTVSIGTASPEVAKCGVAVHDALLATIDAIRPGVTGADVHASCVDALAGHGVEKYFRKRVGYSVGLAFAPDWGEGHIISLGPGEEQLLEPGMVFHVVPAVRVSREFCVGLSETVLVTDDGVEVLTSFHDYLVETVW